MNVEMSGRRELFYTAMKRTSEWIHSLEIPSDVTINVGATSFSLHKSPLVSKCGYVRKIISESTFVDGSVVNIPDVPGGAEAFEYAAKFCYGINFAITVENVAMLRCAAEFLEMTEDYTVGNMIARTEAFINEVILKSLTGAVSVLHSSESLLPIAERVKLVSRCVDTVALLACKDAQFAIPMRIDSGLNDAASSALPNTKPAAAWWTECLTVLRIDFFRRIVIAMISRGFKHRALGPVLVLYAQKSLQGLDVIHKGRMKIDPKDEHEKRVILETVVSLLPRDKNAVPITFLSMLLRAAVCLETTVACRLDLGRRMSMQLHQAVLDDLLIPTYSVTGGTLFDIETVKGIMVDFLEFYEVSRRGCNEADDYFSPSPTEIEQVTELMESYLTHVASDPNFSVLDFTSFAELIPKQFRLTEDGMYRAIDIYLKAHPALSDMERKKVCGVMNSGKLSREARAHVSKNGRLPVQTIVQVLCREQQCLREAMGDDSISHSPTSLPKPKEHTFNNCSLTDELSNLRRENQDLKIELVKTKTRLKEMEKSSNQLPAEDSPLPITSRFHHMSPLPWKSLVSSFSRRIGRFVIWGDGSAIQSSKGRSKEPRKVRRHSLS